MMAWSHSSHLGHKLHKNLEPPHVHSHNILSPLGSGCNSLRRLHNSVLHMYHHIHILHLFLVQGVETRVFSGCLLSRPLGAGALLTVGGGGTPWVTVAPRVMAPLTGVPHTKAPHGGPTPWVLGTRGAGGAAPQPLTGTQCPQEGAATPFK